MQTHVISIITEDKPGVVERLANIVSQAHGNWQASNFCQLAGQFAGILEVSIEPSHLEQLKSALKSTGYQTHIATASVEFNLEQPCHVIEITGNDRVGIVKEISSLIAQHGINVIKLTSRNEPAPNWGGNLFKAVVEIKSPSDEAIEAARNDIEAMANDLIVDIIEN